MCELLAGNPEYSHHVAFRDGTAVVFLSKYPSQLGHLLVAPIAHREHVLDDFTPDEYAALQRVVHRAGRALADIVPTERMYVLSLGSQQGNRHAHWHLVPLPPGVPYEAQQLEAMTEELGYLDVPDDELGALAAQIGVRMGDLG